MTDRTNVTWHKQSVSRDDRERLNEHVGCVVWLTGLSGCGKSTIANLADRKLYERGVCTCLLDGDNIRHGLNASPSMLMEGYGEAFARRFGLGFSAEDRAENIRRIGAVAQLFCSCGLVTLTAFVSPYRKDRDQVRKHVERHGREGDYLEIFVDTPLEICEARDPKGLYKKARAGEIKNFTGVDDPYEPPGSPELILRSHEKSPDELANQLIAFLEARGKIK